MLKKFQLLKFAVSLKINLVSYQLYQQSDYSVKDDKLNQYLKELSQRKIDVYYEAEAVLIGFFYLPKVLQEVDEVIMINFKFAVARYSKLIMNESG